VRSGDVFRTATARIAVSEVIGEDDDEIGLLHGFGCTAKDAESAEDDGECAATIKTTP
jgi:hypothetical protein